VAEARLIVVGWEVRVFVFGGEKFGSWGLEAGEVGGEAKPYILVGVGERRIRHQPAKQSGASSPRTLACVLASGIGRNCEARKGC
jgi:hypothetical protein